MRIGVDATCWTNARGYGRHARSLLSALVRLDKQNQYTFLTDSTRDLETMPAGAEIRCVHASVATVIAASANGRRSLADMWRMSRALSHPDLDLVLFPTIYSYVPVFSRAKKIVMIHDVIAERYPRLTLPTAAARLSWKIKAAAGRWQADAIVTVSEYSKRAIFSRFQVPQERIFVVGEASDPVFRLLDGPRPTPRLASLGFTGNGRSIVYVGGFSPHKNLAALVSVFARLCARQEYSDIRLVMIGEYEKEVFHSYFATIRKQVEDLGLGDRVLFTGYLPDDELVVLLNLSSVLVLPSLMEGFGLPAIEAAACGCPVIATTFSPLPSILDGAGIFIDPTRDEELQSALERVLGSESLRERMREAAVAAAGQFTWDAAARQMMRVLEQVR